MRVDRLMFIRLLFCFRSRLVEDVLHVKLPLPCHVGCSMLYSLMENVLHSLSAPPCFHFHERGCSCLIVTCPQMNVVNEPFGPAPPGLHIHESFCSRFKRQPPSLNKSYNKSLHAPQATVFFTALMACPQATRVGLAFNGEDFIVNKVYRHVL